MWNEKAINTDTIMVHVRNIRDKIEINPRDPKYLKVVWGVGYKIENNNRNNGAGNNNVSASNGADGNSSNRNNGGSNSDVNSNTGKNSGADSNAGNSNNRNNGGSNSNAVNSSKRIIIAIAGIIFITIITMCFFPVVYRTAERQKEQQKAEMMRESSDSVDNDTVQTLYQGSYVLYVEQMERSGRQMQADCF